MWPTSEGDRVLRGSEAALLARAIDTMLGPLVDYLGSDEEGEPEPYAAVLQTGISVFDSLAIEQRIAALHHAAQYLLTPSPFPNDSLSAADDATVAAIYGEIRDQIEIEIDFSNAPLSDLPGGGELPPWTTERALDEPLLQWRRLVHSACCEVLGEGRWCELASDRELASLELGEWELWVDALASAILWDRDYEFAEAFLDADPDAARRRRQLLGITDDYFVRPAPDPGHRQINRLVRQTRRLVRRVRFEKPGDARRRDDESNA